MNEKLNIAEILKDCPKGMELDCTLFENLEFDRIDEDGRPYSIICRVKTEWGSYNVHTFTEYGCYSTEKYSKCAIFPKGKTSWEGFVPPCEFKDGDVIFTHANCLNIGLGNTWISIFKENRNSGVATYVDYCNEGKDYYTYLEDKGLLCEIKDILLQRFATEEEKEKLFKAIKDNGYRWNAETKTLEKLIIPKFKVGDRVKQMSAHTVGRVVKVDDKGYYIDYPKGEGVCFISFMLEKDYELTPNKFDISTFKPFESRVLVRTSNKWVAAFYSHYDKEAHLHYCVVGGLWYKQCIPYESNEHLLDTTDDCDEYYKTWE